MNDERVSENLDLTSPSRILPSKRCGAELRRQNIRTSALPAREVRRLTLMGESLTEPCQLRPLYYRSCHQWRLVARGCDIPVVVVSCQPRLVYLPGDRGGWPVCNCNYRPPKPFAASKKNTFNSCLPQRPLAWQLRSLLLKRFTSRERYDELARLCPMRA